MVVCHFFHMFQRLCMYVLYITGQSSCSAITERQQKQKHTHTLTHPCLWFISRSISLRKKKSLQPQNGHSFQQQQKSSGKDTQMKSKRKMLSIAHTYHTSMK